MHQWFYTPQCSLSTPSWEFLFPLSLLSEAMNTSLAFYSLMGVSRCLGDTEACKHIKYPLSTPSWEFLTTVCVPESSQAPRFFLLPHGSFLGGILRLLMLLLLLLLSTPSWEFRCGWKVRHSSIGLCKDFLLPHGSFCCYISIHCLCNYNSYLSTPSWEFHF